MPRPRLSRFALALLACALALSIAGAGGCRERPEAAPRTRIRMATGTPGGGFYPLGAALASALGGSLPQVEIETHPSAGAVSNLEAIQAGEADLGFAFADVAYVASVGGLE